MQKIDLKQLSNSTIKNMEKIQHKLFMESNKLDSSDFSDPVQKKMKIFDQMLSKAEDTVAEDRKQLLRQLKELDHEIQEDMLDELEDQLENNEVVEETDTRKESSSKSEAKKGPTDEKILDELWKIGRIRGLSRSFLKQCGIRTNISGWTIPLGKYVLHRTAVFSYKYNLQKLK